MTSRWQRFLKQHLTALALATGLSLIACNVKAEVIGGSPAGCPRVAFCGCALSVEIFGRPVRNLWPARGWYRFARTHARPGAVGVRPHHVLKLLSHVSGTKWLVFDPNSGGHKTRIHERDLRGYTFVAPHSYAEAH